MFNFFKRSKAKRLPIKRGLEIAKEKKLESYSITIMIKDQVLFQIFPSQIFAEQGFEPKEKNSFIELHFFNKNKTRTKSIHDKFKEGNLKDEFFYFEDPPNNHNYIREIGSDFTTVEKKAIKTIEKIYQVDFDELSLEVIGK